MSGTNGNSSLLERQIAETLKQYDDLFLKVTADNTNTEGKIEEVNALIEHVNGRITYTESRITKMVTFSIALIGAGLVLFGATRGLQNPPTFWFGIVSSGLLILTGSFSALIYTLQINPEYPFKDLENDWKWFYPRIVDKDYGPKMWVFENNEHFVRKRLLHVKGLAKYAELMIKESPNERLKVDIQQLYLLHVNEKYKNTFLSHIRNVLRWGLSLTVISVIVFLLIITVNSPYKQPATTKSENKTPIYSAPLKDKPVKAKPNSDSAKHSF